jgi:hypothetical protein
MHICPHTIRVIEDWAGKKVSPAKSQLQNGGPFGAKAEPARADGEVADEDATKSPKRDAAQTPQAGQIKKAEDQYDATTTPLSTGLTPMRGRSQTQH